MTAVPPLLIAFRVTLGPLLLVAATHPAMIAWIVPILAAATISDIFDGVIARKIGTATEELRVADSRADFWFYMWVCAACWARSADIITAFRVPLLTLLCMDVASYGIDLIKFKRIATFHAYTAKVWGLTLFVCAVALLGFHRGGIWMWLMISVGIISNLDGLTIKLILPEWQHDVLSCVHAWRSVRGGITD
jgi:CDP-diacylglycerol--glycerol-3-phosphate 3-phosphatidyltransferase